jgi:hypothetical protein
MRNVGCATLVNVVLKQHLQKVNQMLITQLPLTAQLHAALQAVPAAQQQTVAYTLASAYLQMCVHQLTHGGMDELSAALARTNLRKHINNVLDLCTVRLHTR